MGLREGDLENVTLKNISIDEFEPKTGEVKDVIVVAFHVTEQPAGKDLYTFINNSRFNVRDVEVSPNPNEHGNYLVFVEFTREDEFLERLRELVRDIERVTGKLRWKATTHLTDEYFSLDNPEIEKYLITDPENYMTRKEFEQSQEPESTVDDGFAEAEDYSALEEFMSPSVAQKVEFSEGRMRIKHRGHSAELEVVGLGSDELLVDLGINESAVSNADYSQRLFDGMISPLKSVMIENYLVLFNPYNSEKMLVTKKCSL